MLNSIELLYYCVDSFKTGNFSSALSHTHNLKEFKLPDNDFEVLKQLSGILPLKMHLLNVHPNKRRVEN